MTESQLKNAESQRKLPDREKVIRRLAEVSEYTRAKADIAGVGKVKEIFDSWFRAAEDAIALLREPTDWIRVEDRLPEPPRRCLVYTPYNEYGDGMFLATFTEFGWMTPGYIGQVTHWKPLPEKPDDVPNGFRIGGVMEVTADMLEEGGGGDADGA